MRATTTTACFEMARPVPPHVPVVDESACTVRQSSYWPDALVRLQNSGSKKLDIKLV